MYSQRVLFGTRITRMRQDMQKRLPLIDRSRLQVGFLAIVYSTCCDCPIAWECAIRRPPACDGFVMAVVGNKLIVQSDFDVDVCLLSSSIVAFKSSRKAAFCLITASGVMPPRDSRNSRHLRLRSCKNCAIRD